MGKKLELSAWSNQSQTGKFTRQTFTGVRVDALSRSATGTQSTNVPGYSKKAVLADQALIAVYNINHDGTKPGSQLPLGT